MLKKSQQLDLKLNKQFGTHTKTLLLIFVCFKSSVIIQNHVCSLTLNQLMFVPKTRKNYKKLQIYSVNIVKNKLKIK